MPVTGRAFATCNASLLKNKVEAEKPINASGVSEVSPALTYPEGVRLQLPTFRHTCFIPLKSSFKSRLSPFKV